MSNSAALRFFINPSIFGSKFPLRTGKRRFALTNFHVVDELIQRKCFLCYPEKGKSQITAEIVFIVPSLDVAILMVDPDGEHSLWFDDEDIGTFIKSIPNHTTTKTEIRLTMHSSLYWRLTIQKST